jgi:hypothetical protein
MAKGFKTGGRKKGTPNKADGIREQFFSALRRAGGEQFIYDTLQSDPVAMTKVIASLLPKEQDINLNGFLKVELVSNVDES